MKMKEKLKKYGSAALDWLFIAGVGIGAVALGLSAVAAAFSLAIGVAVGMSLLKGVVPGIVLWLVWSYFDIAKDLATIPAQYHDIALWKFILGCAAVNMVIRMITGRGLNLPKPRKAKKVEGSSEVSPA